MRTVVKPSEVPHLWAHAAQPGARNQQGNVSFHGSALYSYAAIIGQRIEPRKGEVCFFLSSRSFSPTTSRHQTEATYACQGMGETFTVPDLSVNYYNKPTGHRANLKYFKVKIERWALKAKRARLHGAWNLAQAQTAVDQGNRYAQVFRLATRFSLPNDTHCGEIIRKGREAKARERIQTKARQAVLLVEQKEAIAEWRNGQRAWIPGNYQLPVFLRVMRRDTGGYVETSKGARVPLEDAKRLALQASNVQRQGSTYHPVERVTVGPYKLDRINADGTVVVGCHTIPWTETERVARVLGVLN